MEYPGNHDWKIPDRRSITAEISLGEVWEKIQDLGNRVDSELRKDEDRQPNGGEPDKKATREEQDEVKHDFIHGKKAHGKEKAQEKTGEE